VADTPTPRRAFIEEVTRVVARIGEQHHPALSGPTPVQAEARALFARYARNYGRINRGLYDPRDQDPVPDWTGLLLEPVYDALAQPDPARQRDHLVNVAATAIAWAADIDRQEPTRG